MDDWIPNLSIGIVISADGTFSSIPNTIKVDGLFYLKLDMLSNKLYESSKVNTYFWSTLVTYN